MAPVNGAIFIMQTKQFNNHFADPNRCRVRWPRDTRFRYHPSLLHKTHYRAKHNIFCYSASLCGNRRVADAIHRPL